MMEQVIALYKKEAANAAAYDAAKAANDQDGIEAARKAHKANNQEAIDNGQEFCFMLRLYNDMMERGNTLIALDDVHDYQAEEVTAIFHRFGILRFAFSSTWSSAISAMWELTAHGYSMDGMAQINGRYANVRTGEHEKIPAIIFSVNV